MSSLFRVKLKRGAITATFAVEAESAGEAERLARAKVGRGCRVVSCDFLYVIRGARSV